MDKSALRKIYKKKRKELTSDEREEASIKIALNLAEKWNFKQSTISCFLPIQRLNEVNTATLIQKLGVENNLCAPVADFSSTTMIHRLIDDATLLKHNDWSIPEPVNGVMVSPEALDVVIVPLLISDQKGYRVGYGKGFYDRFLSQCKKTCLFVGINYFEPISEITGTHKNDIALHFTVTPCSIIEHEST